MKPDVALSAIERQTWMKPVEEALKKNLDGAFAGDTARGKPIENALHGVWLGHALHPVLTDVPIGAWTVAFVLDAVEETTGARRYRAGADAALNIGLAGAVGAAITGIADWKEISVEARRVGMVHGVLNLVATGLYLTSSVQRAKGKRGAGRICAYLGFAISAGSAWLGGHLVYANQIGVQRTPSQPPPEEFVPVLQVDRLEEATPTKAKYEDYSLLLVKKGERIYALSDVCSHLGAPLSEGKLEDDCIRCPWHGSVFSLEDGAVIESPATIPQPVFDARVRDGQIEVMLRKSV